MREVHKTKTISIIVAIISLSIGAVAGSFASVPVSNKLLSDEIANSQSEYENIGKNFGFGFDPGEKPDEETPEEENKETTTEETPAEENKETTTE